MCQPRKNIQQIRIWSITSPALTWISQSRPPELYLITRSVSHQSDKPKVKEIRDQSLVKSSSGKKSPCPNWSTNQPSSQHPRKRKHQGREREREGRWVCGEVMGGRERVVTSARRKSQHIKMSHAQNEYVCVFPWCLKQAECEIKCLDWCMWQPYVCDLYM